MIVRDATLFDPIKAQQSETIRNLLDHGTNQNARIEKVEREHADLCAYDLRPPEGIILPSLLEKNQNALKYMKNVGSAVFSAGSACIEQPFFFHSSLYIAL
jgi:hypothetical protein